MKRCATFFVITMILDVQPAFAEPMSDVAPLLGDDNAMNDILAKQRGFIGDESATLEATEVDTVENGEFFVEPGQHHFGAKRQALEDAWWTGPLLTASASPLPRGHVLLEPYFYDVVSRDGQHFGTRSYLLYGLTDSVTVGLIPVFGVNRVKGARNSSSIGVGDLTLMGQYRITKFRSGSWSPTISAVVQQSLPTGRYHRLGDRPANGIGTGTYTTTLAVYSQSMFWLPNGRILRARLNMSRSFSSHAKLADVSVYGTTAGFRGRARPGARFEVSTSLEYSLTRHWVLAFDVIHSQGKRTWVTGLDRSDSGSPRPVRFGSEPYRSLAFAPAIEYNFSASFGMIVGARIIPASRNRTGSVTPIMAFNKIF